MRRAKELDWNWYHSASAFVAATCSEVIAAKFGEIAETTKDTDAAQMFLSGLALNLSPADLRTVAIPATTAA